MITKQFKILMVEISLEGGKVAYEGKCPYGWDNASVGWREDLVTQIRHTGHSNHVFHSQRYPGKYFIPCLAHLHCFKEYKERKND
jgi:hypothetical protein